MRARRQSSKPTIEVWALPFGGWNVVVLLGARVLSVSGACPTKADVRGALDAAAVARAAVEEVQYA